MRKTALKQTVRWLCCGGCAPQPTEPDKRAPASMDPPLPMRHASGACPPPPVEALNFLRRRTRGNDALARSAEEVRVIDEAYDNSKLPTFPKNMFPSREFQIAPCGTYLIARSGTYTVKDCRTEQRARWAKIRWRAQMRCEKEEREATVLRWKERSHMKRQDKDVVDGMMADGRVPDDGP